MHHTASGNNEIKRGNFTSDPAKDQDPVTLVPKDGIIVSNSGMSKDGGKIKDAKPTKFALFTEDWIQMQNFVTAALKLPISDGDFDTKYGEFEAKSKDAITHCVGAFKELRASAEDFGNPAVLLREIQNLKGGAKPPSIYGEIVWVANAIADAARTFKFTYSQLGQVLTESMPKEERREALIGILTGPGGLRDTAVEMGTKTDNLVKRLAAFSGKISKNQEAINAYANSSGQIYKEAVTKVGELGEQLSKLRIEIQKANDAYIGYAAGAGGGAALIFIFTFGLGWPVALAYGVGMGVGGAEMARQAMENFKTELEKAKGDQQKKLVLQADLEGLNAKIGSIKNQVDAVCAGLKTIVGVWNNQVSVLDSIVKSTELEKMLTFTAINQKLGILNAQEKWNQVATDTTEFTSNAFVEYREEVKKAA
jgi:hypothetical protein